MMKRVVLVKLWMWGLLWMAPFLACGQTGISVSPPRTYFTLEPGNVAVKQLTVSNPSKTDTLQLAISLADWTYDTLGNNVVQDAGQLANSCASWITVLPQLTFTLPPGKSENVSIRMEVPTALADRVPVHTAMLYVSQTNPVKGLDAKGALINVAIRSGVKIYHRTPVPRNLNMEVLDFKSIAAEQPHLDLLFKNTGNTWVDGTVSCSLLNQENGKETKLSDVVFYSLPGTARLMELLLPADLPPGNYTATALINYGDVASVAMAELNFHYGP